MTLAEKVGQLVLENAFAPIDWMEVGRQRKLADEQGLPYEIPLELSGTIEDRVRDGHVSGHQLRRPEHQRASAAHRGRGEPAGHPAAGEPGRACTAFAPCFPSRWRAPVPGTPTWSSAPPASAAVEASTVGINWFFAPMVDIARDPRWGRIAEGAGRTPSWGVPWLGPRCAAFRAPICRRRFRIAACPKHYAGYGAAEAGRDYNTVDISERTLRDVYLPPFKAAFDAGRGQHHELVQRDRRRAGHLQRLPAAYGAARGMGLFAGPGGERLQRHRRIGGARRGPRPERRRQAEHPGGRRHRPRQRGIRHLSRAVGAGGRGADRGGGRRRAPRAPSQVSTWASSSIRTPMERLITNGIC